MGYVYHISETFATCETTNNYLAFLNSLMIFTITYITLLSFEITPILKPFQNIFGLRYITNFSAKVFLLQLVIIILFTYTSLASVKNTCRLSIEDIKKTYVELQKNLK